MIKPRPDTQALCRAVGACIRRRRLANGLTGRAMAKLVHTHHPIVSRVERGVGACTLDTVQRYAVALGCTASELLAEAEASVKASVVSGTPDECSHQLSATASACVNDKLVELPNVRRIEAQGERHLRGLSTGPHVRCQ